MNQILRLTQHKRFVPYGTHPNSAFGETSFMLSPLGEIACQKMRIIVNYSYERGDCHGHQDWCLDNTLPFPQRRQTTSRGMSNENNLELLY
jgi:hypothetical protein